jgi:hypothetical protein
VVYLIVPGKTPNDTIAARVLEPDQLQSLALAVSPAGDVLVGTGNSGAAYRISLRDRAVGTFTSTVFDAKNIVRWGALRFVGREVSLQTRSGNTDQPDKTWSAWQDALTNEIGEWRIASPDARFLQYRARFASRQATAGLVRIEAVYRTKNSPPTVALTSPAGGEYWKGKKKLTWSGKDPDGDTLRYRVFFSADEGRSWSPLELTDDAATSFELDTSKWKDGVYRLRLESDDSIRNPEDPQRDETLSLPFTVDNTPPRLEGGVRRLNGTLAVAGIAEDALAPIAGAEWRFLSDKKTEEKKADEKPDTRAVPELKIADAKDTKAKKEDEWQAAAPADSIFDSRRESFLAPLRERVGTQPAAPETTSPAPRRVEIRAQDAAGNSVTIETTVTE